MLHLVGVLEHVFAEVRRDPDHLEALGAVRALQFLEQRDFAPAGAHQVAQKFTIRDLSGQSCIDRSLPFAVRE